MGQDSESEIICEISGSAKKELSIRLDKERTAARASEGASERFHELAFRVPRSVAL